MIKRINNGFLKQWWLIVIAIIAVALLIWLLIGGTHHLEVVSYEVNIDLQRKWDWMGGDGTNVPLQINVTVQNNGRRIPYHYYDALESMTARSRGADGFEEFNWQTGYVLYHPANGNFYFNSGDTATHSFYFTEIPPRGKYELRIHFLGKTLSTTVEIPEVSE